MTKVRFDIKTQQYTRAFDKNSLISYLFHFISHIYFFIEYFHSLVFTTEAHRPDIKEKKTKKKRRRIKKKKDKIDFCVFKIVLRKIFT